MARDELERQFAELHCGGHLCAVYETVQEQMAIVVPYLRDALAHGHRCVYVTDDLTADDFMNRLAEAGFDVKHDLGRGVLRILVRGDAYLRSGAFDPDEMLEFLGEQEDDAVAGGFSCVRIIGEMTWALGPETGCERLIEFEARLNAYTEGRKMLVLCLYNRRRFDPSVVHDVLRTHPTVILGDMVCPNPYYESPALVLGAGADADCQHKARRAEWWIARLKLARAEEMERQRLYEKLRESSEMLERMSRRLLAVQEEERRRLARELHDEAGQRATRMRFLIESIADHVPESEPVHQKLDEARAILDEHVDQMRKLSANLRPALLDELGLLPAVRDHVKRFYTSTGVRVDFRADAGAIRFDADVETAAYRIIQEALTNIARHANVKEGSVRIWLDRDALKVQIEDSGVGFDFNSVRELRSSHGLRGIEERVMLLGGSVEIESSPGGGTSVTASLPAANTDGK